MSAVWARPHSVGGQHVDDACTGARPELGQAGARKAGPRQAPRSGSTAVVAADEYGAHVAKVAAAVGHHVDERRSGRHLDDGRPWSSPRTG